VHDPLGASAYSRYTNVNTHPVGDYPFFSYDIAFRPANSNNWDAPSDPQPVAPPAVAGNGPFTNISPWSHSYNSNPDPAGIPTNPSRSVFYKNWSMDSVSLAGHGGERARITFRVVDCPWGQGSGQTASPGHYIYAYIDGLCGEDTSSTSQDSSAYCCPGENLVMNGNFELRDSLFSSDYRPVPGKGGIGGIGNVDSVSMGPGGRVVGVPEWTETPGGTPAPGGATTPAGLVNRMVESYRHASKYRPGCYAVVTSEKALEICDQWVVKDHSACTEGYSGSKFMVVNGRTQQTHPKKAVIWQQTVTVEKDSNYKFCAHVKNLAQCCFDMKPIVAVTIDPVTCIDWQTIDAGSGECDWQLLQKDFKATGTSVTIKILLYECLNGDGNDLAIDDISLQKVPPAPLASTSCTFSYSYPPGDENHFNLTFNQPPPPIDGGFDGDTAECGYYWTVCKIKPDGSIIDGSVVQNPSAWWTYPQSNTFAGYNSTSTLGDVSKPGLFDKNTLYRITYGVWCRCLTWNQSSWKVEWNPGKGAAGPTITPDTKYRPSPESIKKIMKDVEEQHKSR